MKDIDTGDEARDGSTARELPDLALRLCKLERPCDASIGDEHECRGCRHHQSRYVVMLCFSSIDI